MSSILNSVHSGGLQRQCSLMSSRKEDSIIDILGSNTGFGNGNSLQYETSCKKPSLKTPLYLDNYLGEFKSEEEKAAARHSLGIYNQGDVVAMSLLTTEGGIPSSQSLLRAPIKQIKQGNEFFAPVTVFNAVYDSDGVSLLTRMNSVQTSINAHTKELLSITQVSNSKNITSLGDVQIFLQGFNNGDNLLTTLDDISQEMLRFEKTGEIIN